MLPSSGDSSVPDSKGQRIIRAHFREGYLPYRVTVPSQDGTMRYVYKFNYWSEEAQ